MYVRYQSFDSQEALEEGIKKTMPYKIDIGAIFSVKVNHRPQFKILCGLRGTENFYGVVLGVAECTGCSYST